MSTPDHLSHSSLTTYKECGEKYRLTRIVKVPEQPGWALVGGSAVHSCSEALDLEAHGIPSALPTTFMECFEEEIAEREENSGVASPEWRISGRKSAAWPNKEDRAWWEYHGQSFVDNYVNWRNRFTGNIWITPDGRPAIEIQVNANHGGSVVTGYIDRIFENPDKSLRVVDIKAGRTTPTDSLQLAVYAWSLPNLWPRPVTGSYFMARDGMLVGDYDLSRSKPLLDYEYGAAWAGIQNGIYPARQSYQCGYCSVREYCWLQNGDLAEAVKPF